jgi:AraC-like DNA-binding protein
MTFAFDNTVSTSSVLDLIDAAYGLSIIAADSQLPNRAQFTNPEGRVNEQVLIDIWQHLERHAKIPCYGLMIGQHINPNAKGLLASVVSQCETMSEAFNTFVKYLSWMSPSEAWQLKMSGDGVELIFTLEHAKNYPVSAIERSMSALVNWASFLSGEIVNVIRADFEFEKPEYHDFFASTFGENIHFSSSKNSIFLSNTLLDKALVNHNPYLRDLLEDNLKQNIIQLESFKSPVNKQAVNELVLILLPEHKATIDEVCRHFFISRQTLYRHLKKDSTDFKSILEEARKFESVKLLSLPENSIQSVSDKLGYKDVSSFYAAFSRWYGESASQYRKALLQKK